MSVLSWLGQKLGFSGPANLNTRDRRIPYLPALPPGSFPPPVSVSDDVPDNYDDLLQPLNVATPSGPGMAIDYDQLDATSVQNALKNAGPTDPLNLVPNLVTSQNTTSGQDWDFNPRFDFDSGSTFWSDSPEADADITDDDDEPDEEFDLDHDDIDSGDYNSPSY